MKLNVAGVQRIVGQSKSSGNPFDMCNLLILVPVEIVNNGKLQINGVGLRIKEFPLAPEALPKFLAIPAQSFPLELEIETDVRPGMKGFDTVATGFKMPTSLKAAA